MSNYTFVITIIFFVFSSICSKTYAQIDLLKQQFPRLEYIPDQAEVLYAIQCAYKSNYDLDRMIAYGKMILSNDKTIIPQFELDGKAKVLLSKWDAVYPIEKMNKELTLAELENRQIEQAAQLKQMQLYNIILILLVLGMLLVGGIIYRNSKKVTTLYTQLEYSNSLLKESNSKLAQKNKQLNRYTDSISHDILSKLKLIVYSGNHLVEDQNAPLNNYKMYYDESRSAARWLRQYCIDLLAWAKQEQEGSSSSTLLQTVVEDILQSYQTILDHHHFEVEVQNLDQLIPIPQAPLKQIIQNLVDNGIKFSKDQSSPKLKIHAQKEGATLTLSIEDNGIGLPNELRGNLLHNEHLQNVGTSKGLAIVNSLVEQYNGNFIGEDSNLKGAKFKVSFA